MEKEALNVVAATAGAFHALALKENGAVVAWGLNTSSQCVVPAGLSNVLAVAAGRAHSTALKNDGTVVAWGDNTYEQTDVGGGLKGSKLLAAGGDHTLASAFSPLVQYQVDVSKDLLLIYNSSSTDSSNVWHYYMQHRPMVSGANVLAVGCPTTETTYPWDLTNTLLSSVSHWLEINPTKRPQYVVLFPNIPSRVNGYSTNGYANTNVFSSVSYTLHTNVAGWRPFVTHINMPATDDCIAYINKLAAFGTNGQLVISAGAAYGNANYVVDNVRHGEYGPDTLRAATNGILSAGVSPAALFYVEAAESCIAWNTNGDCIARLDYSHLHLSNITNVAGYISWGAHSTLGGNYAADGKVKWGRHSAWWIIETVESYNGQIQWPSMGHFTQWYSANAFGGTNYSNTPVGAVTQVDEPQISGVNDARLYFGLWASGKNFAISAWNSLRIDRFQAVGDPLVTR